MQYSLLAAYYDKLMEREIYADLYEFYKSAWGRYGSKPRSALDLACGTGGMMPFFERDGIDVIAVDISPEMLGAAREKCPADALLLCQNMTELDLYGTVDFAYCALDGMNCLLTDAEFLRALSRVELFLEPGGLFIFDINSEHKFRSVLDGHTYVYEHEDLFLVWESGIRGRTGLCDFELTFFVKERSGLYERLGETITERIYAAEKVKKLIAKSGLELVAVCGDDFAAPPREDAERLLFITRKKL